MEKQVSITDARSGEVDYRSDSDNTVADDVIDAILGPVFGASTVFFSSEDTADTVYQKFRLSGGSHSLSWFAGVSYYFEELNSPYLRQTGHYDKFSYSIG